jgi:hypothetical protein
MHMTRQNSLPLPDLPALEKQHEAQRIKALEALEALQRARRNALLQLQKTQILFRYLNWKQQEQINSKCTEGFSLQKIYALSAASLPAVENTGNSLVPAITGLSASYLLKLKTVRKNIVQFGIVQARAHELIEAIVKSASVFNYQYKAACRELFPLGIFSRIRRHIQRFFHHPYFSWQEIGCLQNLGAAAGFVLKMAETPVLGARQW